MKKNKIILVILFHLIFHHLIFCQDKIIDTLRDTAIIYKITMDDGSVFMGNILKEDSTIVIFETQSIPRIEIPVKNISSKKIIFGTSIKKGKYWFPNPNSTRYLFGPSAICLNKGEGYYQNTYLVLNSFNIGLTNNLSIGGGLEFISTFGTLAEGDFQPIIYLTPKIGFKIIEKLNIGGGIIYLNLPADNSSVGIVYEVTTLGTPDNNITMGLGWGFMDREFETKPFITLAGMKRISPKTALITENWFIPSDKYYGLYSYGIRFFGEKLAVDLAFINNSDIMEALIIGVPYVDFVVKF